MANHLESNGLALPNPFQNSTVPPIINSTTKSTSITQNDTNYFHGYRSNFDINQQKQQYQQRLNQQNSQKPQFHRNGPWQQNQRTNQRNATMQQSNNDSHLSNWCDLCERGFRQPYQLEKHLDEHEKCWFDNCNFEGHSTLLKKHIETQHQSGLFQRIGKIETDEDIEKWREERRKKYPTKANIEARRQAQEERLKRGERINEPNQRFGDSKNRNRAQHRSFAQDSNDSNKSNIKTKNDRKRRRTRNRNRNCNKINSERKNENEKMTNKDVEVVKTETVSVSTSTVNKSQDANCTNQSYDGKVANSGALAAIMGLYGSDSDSECDDDVEASMTESKNEISFESSLDMVEPVKDTEISHTNEDVNLITKSNSFEVSAESINLKRSFTADDEVRTKLPKVESNINQNMEIDIKTESDNEAPDEQPIQRLCDNLEQLTDVVSGPTQTKPDRMTRNNSKVLVDRAPKRKTILDMTRKIRNQNTLLEKLLQKDIRHERNVLLQCVRYVVENQFFGIGQNKEEQNNQTKSDE